jgi:GNAT superfamily N-acetyltransferase
MIRPATPDDMPALMALGEQMHAESPQWSRMRFNGERLAATLYSLLESERGFLWVAERDGRVIGGMAAMCAPHWACDAMVSSDLALFVAPEARGTLAPVRLVRRYVQWANGMGVAHPNVGITTGVHVERTAAVLEAAGMRRCGLILEG